MLLLISVLSVANWLWINGYSTSFWILLIVVVAAAVVIVGHEEIVDVVVGDRGFDWEKNK